MDIGELATPGRSPVRGRPESSAEHPGASSSLFEPRRLSDTVDHAGVGIVEIDAEGRLLRVNASLADLMGYATEELLARSIFDETYADDVDADREQFRRQVAGEIDRYRIEKRLRRRDGSYVWCQIQSTSVRDDAGRFRYAVRVQHDISDRKRAEEALARRQEEQAALYEFTYRLQKAPSLDDVYRHALDAILRALRCQRAAILLFDKAGRMRFTAWRGLSDGYRQAVDGHSPWPADAEEPSPICIADTAGSGLDSALATTVKAEGIGAIAFIPLQEGGRLLGKFMAYYDAPHEFNAEELNLARTIAGQLGYSIERIRARKAAQHLSAIVESSEDAIVSKDLNGVISTWNRGAERLFGYTAEEVVGKPITILIPPERLGEEPTILERIRRGDHVSHFETVRRRKDGSEVPISLTVSPVRDRNGTIVGASKIARDITAQKRAEAQQSLLLNELNHRVKNNMQVLQALLHTSSARTESAEAKRVLAEAGARVSAMAAAQRILYDVSRGDAFSAQGFLRAVCDAARESLRASIEIQAVEDADIPNDTAVPLALILNELLTNATKHAPAGKPIRVGLTRDAEGFELFVEDAGPGFDPSAIRGRSSGLRLVQGLASQLRGRFDVRRAPRTRCSLRFA